MISCPFCNLRMYQIVNEDYPKLETYFCYECGFHADTILMSQKNLYQNYQQLYMKYQDVLRPKRLPRLKRTDEILQGEKDDENRRRLDRAPCCLLYL